MNQLHPGARWQFRFSVYFVLGTFFIMFGWFFAAPLVLIYYLLGGESSSWVWTIFAYIFFILVFGEIYARLAYNRWFYEFTDNELKKERGIISKKYSSIPYERIQNVDIQRGIIARLFGFSSLSIQTAGYSGRHDPEGYLPAVDIEYAEQIREFLINKITQSRKNKQGV